jgi:O-antigen ligase
VAPAAGHSKPFARASLILIGLAWVLPFLQSRHGYPLTAFYSEWLAFGLGLAAALLLLTRQAWRKAEIPLIALAPPALALVLGVQVLLGRVPYPEQAITATLYLLWASVLIVLARVLVRELGMTAIASTLAWFVLVGGVLSAIAGYAQTHQIPPEIDFLVTRKAAGRVYGNIGQPNQFAAYLTMALCSVAYLYASGRIRVLGAIACAAVLLPAVALSGSRSPWLYLALTAALGWALFHARRGEETGRLLAYSLGLLPAFIVAALIVAQWGGAASPGTLATGEAISSAQRLFEGASGAEPRVELAAEAWQSFLSAPVLGAGWGQFSWIHFLHIAAAGTTAAPGVYNHAHNLVLHLLAETGAVGALIVIGAIIFWLADLRRMSFTLEWWWVLALLTILGAHSMVEFPLWYSYLLGIAAVLLGVGALQNVRVNLSGIARLTAAALVLAGWFNLVSAIPQYREFERLVFLPGSRSAADLNDKAFAEKIARIHREPTLTPYVELALAFGFSIDERDLADKLAISGRAVRFAPVSYVAYHQALLLALGGEREAALRQLDRTSRVYPGDLRSVHAELVPLAKDRPDAFLPLLTFAESRLR